MFDIFPISIEKFDIFPISIEIFPISIEIPLPHPPFFRRKKARQPCRKLPNHNHNHSFSENHRPKPSRSEANEGGHVVSDIRCVYQTLAQCKPTAASKTDSIPLPQVTRNMHNG